MSNLFKPSTKGEEDLRFIGSYIPTEIHDFLSLYVVHMKKSRSMLVREILEKWVESNPFSEGFLLEALVDETKEQWKTGQWYDKEDFIAEVKSSLEKRKVSVEHIDQIVDRVEKYLKYGKKGTNRSAE
jgi:hypothetical protein